MPVFTYEALSEMTIKNLQEICKKYNIRQGMTKIDVKCS